MRISDWSSDVCSSDLQKLGAERLQLRATRTVMQAGDAAQQGIAGRRPDRTGALPLLEQREYLAIAVRPAQFGDHRQVEQMAVFCHDLRTGHTVPASVTAQWPNYLRFRRAAVRATPEPRLRSLRPLPRWPSTGNSSLPTNTHPRG